MAMQFHELSQTFRFAAERVTASAVDFVLASQGIDYDRARQVPFQVTEPFLRKLVGQIEITTRRDAYLQLVEQPNWGATPEEETANLRMAAETCLRNNTKIKAIF